MAVIFQTLETQNRRKPARLRKTTFGVWTWFGVLALSMAMMVHESFANAAQAGSPAIVAAAQIWVEPGKNTPVAVRVESSGNLSAQTMLIVRGVPDTMRFSEGRLFGPGVWVVSLSALPQLKVYVPEGFSRIGLSLTLATLDGASLATANLTLTAGGAGEQADQTPVVAALPQQLAGTERQAAVALMEKGDGFIKSGNIGVARQFYQRAASSGLPEAAMALAATYDAQELARMNGVVGVQPNPAMAKKWYETARQLGAPGAAARLGRLP